MVSNQRLEELASFYQEFDDFTSPLAVELGVALRELLELRQREEWVKVSERLPKAWIGVLGEDEYGDVWKVHYRGKELGTWGMYSGDSDVTVSRWRLLPAPPKEGL